MRRKYVYRDGKVVDKSTVEDLGERMEFDKGIQPMNGAGDGRGFSFQLPKYYKHAKRFIEKGPMKGRPYWTTPDEAREIAHRAKDNGEDIEWDRGGGIGVA